MPVRDAPPGDTGGFVRVWHGGLVRDGVEIRWLGANAFQLQEDAARALLGVPGSHDRATRTMDAAAALGLRVLRIAGFNDGRRDTVAIQRARGVLDERGIAGLDAVVAMARERHLALVVVLANGWDDYGGLAQYLRWRHLSARERWRAFTDPRIAEDLATYARTLVTHANPRTGLRYSDDPTIVAWEVMNEPRGDGLTDHGEAFARTLVTVARAVREAAPRQLVIAGDEGFDADASAFREGFPSTDTHAWFGATRHEAASALAASPVFDAVTAHVYPGEWGVARDARAAWGDAWIATHASLAERNHKPLFVTEMGVRERGVRAAVLDRWLQYAHDTRNAAITLVWGMDAPGVRTHDDGFVWREGDGVRAVVERWARAW